jgi:hypothetical protein
MKKLILISMNYFLLSRLIGSIILLLILFSVSAYGSTLFKESTVNLASKVNSKVNSPKDQKNIKKTKKLMVSHNGKLTARVPSAPLKQVMDEFSKLTGVKVLWEDYHQDRYISVGFYERSIEDAVLNILYDENYLLFYSSSNEEDKLTKILILPNNKENEKSVPRRYAFLPPEEIIPDFGTFGSQSSHDYIMSDSGEVTDDYKIIKNDYPLFLDSDNKWQNINDFAPSGSKQPLKGTGNINGTGQIVYYDKYHDNKPASPVIAVIENGDKSMSDDGDSCPYENPMGLDADEDGCIDNFDDLLLMIRNMLNITAELQNDLTSKVEDAQKSTSEENTIAAINHLKDFINLAEANVDEQISPEDAYKLNIYSANIIASLLPDDLIMEHANIKFNISGLLKAEKTIPDIIELFTETLDTYGTLELLDSNEHIAQTGILEVKFNDFHVFPTYKTLLDLDKNLDTMFCIDLITVMELPDTL